MYIVISFGQQVATSFVFLINIYFFELIDNNNHYMRASCVLNFYAPNFYILCLSGVKFNMGMVFSIINFMLDKNRNIFLFYIASSFYSTLKYITCVYTVYSVYIGICSKYKIVFFVCRIPKSNKTRKINSPLCLARSRRTNVILVLVL